MTASTDLSDEDFESSQFDVDASADDENAPEGYRTADGQSLFVVLSVVGGVAFFLLQFIVPQILMFSFMPEMVMPGGRFIVSKPELSCTVVWKDQLWIPATEFGGGTNATVLRAATWDGNWVKDSEVQLPGTPSGMLADGDRLWSIAVGSVSVIDGKTVTTSYPSLRLNNPSSPFLRNGKPCVFDRDLQGQQRLLEFVDGQWAAVGWLKLPAGTKSSVGPVPAPSLPPPIAASIANPIDHVTVISTGAEPSVLVVDGGSIWRSRGLPITSVDPSSSVDDPASALHVENGLESLWTQQGWAGSTHIRAVFHERRIVLVGANLGTGMGTQVQAATWELDGPFNPLPAPTVSLFEEFSLVVRPEEAVHLLIDTFPPGGVRTFSLAGGGFVEGPRLSGGGAMMPLSRESLRMSALMSIIPLGLTCVFGIFMHVLIKQYRSNRYAFGHNTVRLASLGRRGVARAIDTVVMWGPSTAVMWWAMFNVEFDKLIEQIAANPVNMIQTIVLVILSLLVYGLVVLIVFSVFEGFWGWSPGKLICGIRVIRTTFEPIGFLRALIRLFLLFIDGFFSYLVGVMLIAFLVKQQRLGDLAADSIVVEAATVPSITSLRHEH